MRTSYRRNSCNEHVTVGFAMQRELNNLSTNPDIRHFVDSLSRGGIWKLSQNVFVSVRKIKSYSRIHKYRRICTKNWDNRSLTSEINANCIIPKDMQSRATRRVNKMFCYIVITRYFLLRHILFKYLQGFKKGHFLLTTTLHPKWWES
jgi:hypothetical protein